MKKKLPTLPQEIILDILCRLPAKSLCRFKSVSKSWYALINSSKFTKLHLHGPKRDKLIVCTTKFVYNVNLERLTMDDDDVYVVEDDSLPWKSMIPTEILENIDREPDMYYRETPAWVKFIASCNGLLCLEVFQDIWVYNPSIKEYRRIPKFCSIRGKLNGFGYIESVDEYNVVMVDYSEKYVDMYSLRTGSWTRTEIDIPSIHLDSNDEDSICLNNAIHWVVDTPMNIVEILVFDLVEKKFELWPGPPGFGAVIPDDSRFRVGLLRGCLYFSSVNCYRDEIWVMKEYGVKESWRMIMIFPGWPEEVKPLCYLKNSDTLLVNMNENELKVGDDLQPIGIVGLEEEETDEDGNAYEDDPKYYWADINPYVESLVSVFQNPERDEDWENWFLD